MAIDDTSAATQTESRERWNQARRKAFLERLYNSLGLTKKPLELLSFEDVQNKLRLNQNAYRGLQQIPLDQIVGSVGRYNDFTRTFLPLVEDDSWRWRRVAELQAELGLPPIELYKVGDAYFVKDGNHRVSVARQFRTRTIEAYVWEYESPVGGLSSTASIDDIIVKEEYRAFLDRTRLEFSHPEQRIELTEPGMYPALEFEIELYRQNLVQIDGEERTYAEAAATWYDLVYTLAVELIAESDILKLFPNRTEADLYVWVSRHRKELSERYGEQVSLRDAMQQLAEAQHKPGTLERVARTVAGMFHSLTPDHHDPTQELVIRPSEEEPLGILLEQLHTTVPKMTYQGERGVAWRHWQRDLRDKLWGLLGMEYELSPGIEVEALETHLISGVERTKIMMTAADGLRIPGYIMAPVDLQEPLPAILLYTGHGAISHVAGIERSAERSSALALAQAGYITMTFEGRGMGELGPHDHVALDNIARLIGRTWLGMVLEDGLRAMDYLQSRSYVKPGFLGVTGLGLGGGQALFHAALDTRVSAAVIQNYIGGDIDPVSVLGHGCDFVPRLLRYADLGDVARLLVPRAVLYAYPKGRGTTSMAHLWFDKMRPMYEILRCPDRTRFVEHDHGSDYDAAIAHAWFDRWLVEEDDPRWLRLAPGEDPTED